MSKRYFINEVFYSVQGEGMRAGTANVFVRFTGCNMRCDTEAGPKSPGGFACDTEFESGKPYTRDELLAEIDRTLAGAPRSWIVLTGGEPALQVDAALCEFLHAAGFMLAIETNGTLELPRKAGRQNELVLTLDAYALDWITLSPKVAEHAVKQLFAHELKYVRGAGQAIPKPAAEATHKLISPTFNGLTLDPEAMQTCLDLVKRNPEWRLSVQMHKSWRVR